MRLKKLLIFSFLFAATFSVNAQLRKQPGKLFNTKAMASEERLSLTGGFGLASYYGDLCDGWSCMSFRPNIGIGAMLRMTDNIGIKTDINYFRLYSDDVWEQRNLDFRSNNIEWYVAAYYQFFPYERFSSRQRGWNVYGYAGVGLLWFSPQGSINSEGNEWYNLRPLQTEGVHYSPFTAIIPFGLGFDLKVSRRWSVLAEAGYRKTFTDYLDDVSSYEWQNLEAFAGNDLARQLSNKTEMGDAYWTETGQYRGNPSRKDGYFIFQVKARYTFVSVQTNYRLRRAPIRKRF